MQHDESRDLISQSSDENSSEDGSETDSVELLVTGRERRKTAGNRYDRELIAEEAATGDDEDEVNLLFADNEEDEDDEFKSDEDDEDAEMSDDDGDDQGPNIAADELEGEKELQHKAKAERVKKRKADMALTTVASLRKKARFQNTQNQQSATNPRPSKRKERLTWVPGNDEGSGRSSLRKQTIAHREVTIARLKASEAHSKKLKALKEQRNKERAKDIPKELTQADRLLEAERIERRNAKSLNRWEAMEKKRVEDQAAKLAALKNRKLEGPVITWWSGKAKWVGQRLNKIGSKDASGIVIEGGVETKKRGRKTKAFHEQMAAAREAELRAKITQNADKIDQPIIILENQSEPDIKLETTSDQVTNPAVTVSERFQLSQESRDGLTGMDQSSTSAIPPQASGEVANLAPDALVLPQSDEDTSTLTKNPQQPLHSTNSSIEQPEAARLSEALASDADQRQHVPIVAFSSSSASVPGLFDNNNVDHDHLPSTADKKEENLTSTIVSADQSNPISTIPSTSGTDSAAVPATEVSTRNLIVLQRFDDLSSENRQDFGFLSNNRKSVKPTRHNQELCPITTLPPKYRDPSTDIGYANKIAYKKLQELKQHQFIWSTMLGCYVGRTGAAAARGVPDGFLQP